MKKLKNLTIFVEGAEDSRFLQDVIQKWYQIPLTTPPPPKKDPKAKNEAGLFADFVHVGGKSSIEFEKQLFIESALQQAKNILFLDADGDSVNEQWGGVEKTRAYLHYLRSTVGIPIDYAYIFPNTAETNVESVTDASGNLETILRNIATEQEFLQCWEMFCECLETQNVRYGKSYNVPDDKAKFYSYIETIKQDKQPAGGTARTYQNLFWNLDYTKDEFGGTRYLKPLKEFLDKFFLSQDQVKA